jgi:hypothetical protein
MDGGAFERPDMFKSKQYRAEAAKYGERVKGSTDMDEGRKLQELQDRLVSLADNEKRLADDYHDAVHVIGPDQPRDAALASEEERVLRCLGGRHHAMECSADDVAAGDLRHRWIGRQVAGDGGASWADRPISAQAQE